MRRVRLRYKEFRFDSNDVGVIWVLFYKLKPSEPQRKYCPLADRLSRPVAYVTNYGSGWRKGVVNQYLEIGTVLTDKSVGIVLTDKSVGTVLTAQSVHG